MHENAQFNIKYCFLILRNVYSSKKCVDSEINIISLNNNDGMFSDNLQKVSEHLRDYFQLAVFNLYVARMMFHAFFYNVIVLVPCPSHLLTLLRYCRQNMIFVRPAMRDHLS